MTNDIATVTRNSYNMGFEKGSQITMNTINAYLLSIGGEAFVNFIIDASNDGTLNKFRVDRIISKSEEIKPIVNPDPTEIGSPIMGREEARDKGYTGNSCSNCGSMEMQIAGHCEVCSSCGTTTGCS